MENVHWGDLYISLYAKKDAFHNLIQLKIYPQNYDLPEAIGCFVPVSEQEPVPELV